MIKLQNDCITKNVCEKIYKRPDQLSMHKKLAELGQVACEKPSKEHPSVTKHNEKKMKL